MSGEASGPRAAVWCVILVAGCGSDGYRVLVHVPGGPDGSARIEVSIVSRCDDIGTMGEAATDQVRQVLWSDGETQALGAVEPGLHAL